MAAIMSIDQCFQHFKKWDGLVPEGYTVNFLGAKARNEYATTQAIPKTWTLQNDYPELTEEYFEWVDLLESVLSAKEEFVFMELGAGYGRWSVNAALAATQQNKKYRILAIEPEPTHFAWLRKNVEENGLDPGKCELVEAAVTAKKGKAEFYMGNPTAWYGQQIRASKLGMRAKLTDDQKKNGLYVGKVRTVTLNQYLERYGMTDLIDMDVQSAEFEILKASQALVDSNAKRVHIGTHSHRIEEGLRKLFKGLGWVPRYDFECFGDRQTPRGVISFVDGVQSWTNPSLQ